MAYEEAAFSRKHSAVSENQNQHQNQHQGPFTAEDIHPHKPKPGSLGAPHAEENKTLPLSHGKPGQANADEQERVKQRAEALALKLAQTYEELSRLLERNPGMKRQMTEGPAKEEKVYQKLKQRLKMADMAPRCQWVRQDGTSCGSPQMKHHIYCFAHMQMAEARDLMLRLPPPEDPNAIQVGLMRIQKAVIEDTISMKKAGLLLYSMQLALTNVGQTTFGKAKDEEMVRETMSEEEAIRENQKPLTTKDTKDTEEEKGLPLMNADERGLEPRREPVEWKPSPDMYRMDTREGMEAYEASFRMKIRTSGDLKIGRSGDREPAPQRTAVPQEDAQPHAVLG
jgi:hypothetical protein